METVNLELNNMGTTEFSPTTSLTHKVMMVRPANFGFNEETASNNAFQTNIGGISVNEVSQKAIYEFDQFVKVLQAKGIQVEVIQDKEFPVNPDAVFPNNWISFHKPDFIVTYPMFASKRRTERRPEIVGILKDVYKIQNQIRFEHFEDDAIYLEGTGSMIFDRENKIAYACKSIRTDAGLFKKFCKELDFEPLLFDATDKHGQPIYHTNVMMALGVNFVVICMESITDKLEQKRLIASFEATGKEIIPISIQQMEQFAGNMIQLKNKSNERFLVMSSKAYASLDQDQISAIESYSNIIHSDLHTIETYGGGSARCMIAEIFLDLL